MNIRRVRALLDKELAELARNRPALWPVLVLATVCLVMPFAVTLAIPRFTGEPLSTDASFQRLVQQVSALTPDLASLDLEAGAQALIFQQFLLMFLLVPISGAMAFAAHSVVGEKLGRTLEPLLATPLTTYELLAGKTLAALLPSLAIMEVAALLYLGGIELFAAPGVAASVLSLRTLVFLLVLGPLSAMVSLQMAIVVSSRVNDARTAQQISVLVVLPIAALMVAQLSGRMWITVPMALAASAVLLVVVGLLGILGVTVFDRETILTRWK